MEILVEEFVSAIMEAWALGRWLGVIGVVSMFSVRIYRLDPIQERLPGKARWASWPMWVRRLSPAVAIVAGTVLLKLSVGMSGGAVVTAALTAGLASFLGHKATKLAKPMRKIPAASGSRPLSLVGDIMTGKLKMGRDPAPKP